MTRSNKSRSNKSNPLKVFTGLLFIIFIYLLAYYFLPDIPPDEQTTDRPFKIVFADVGQGDGIIVQCDEQNMLVDAGTNDNAACFVNVLKGLKINQFDMVVATHPHEDHIGGMDNVINNFDVFQVMMPDVTTNTRTFESLLKAIQNKKIAVRRPEAGENFKIGSATCTVLAPNSLHYEELNDYSIVLRIVYGNSSFLLTGDAGVLTENEIILKGYELKSDLLKIGHHGSSSSTGDEFLKKVAPQYAVISAGQANDYGHPHKETISKLDSAGVKIYRTDLNGQISVSSDGTNLEITKGK